MPSSWICLVRRGDARAARLDRALARRRDLTRISSMSDGQRRFGVGGNGEVDVRVAAEVVDVAALEQMLGRDADGLAAVGARRARLRRHVVDLEAEHHVRRIAAPAVPVERMPRRELLPRRVAHDVDRRLERLGQLDEQVPGLRRASELGDLDQRRLRR